MKLLNITYTNNIDTHPFSNDYKISITLFKKGIAITKAKPHGSLEFYNPINDSIEVGKGLFKVTKVYKFGNPLKTKLFKEDYLIKKNVKL